MRPHLHTDLPHALYFALATLVIIHAMRAGAAWLATRDNGAATTAGKAIGAFALAD